MLVINSLKIHRVNFEKNIQIKCWYTKLFKRVKIQDYINENVTY